MKFIKLGFSGQETGPNKKKNIIYQGIFIHLRIFLDSYVNFH